MVVVVKIVVEKLLPKGEKRGSLTAETPREFLVPQWGTVQRDVAGTHGTVHASSDTPTLDTCAVTCWIAHLDEELASLWELVGPHTISLSFMPSANAAPPSSALQ
jgi:hypothetical protein